MTATLVLIRHGEIVRPPETSNFDRAPLSAQGEEQIRRLAMAWPVDRPSVVFTSPLRRAIESAVLFTREFRVPMRKRPCLKEWTPDESGIPQDEYKALERRAWDRTAFIPPSKESLDQAADRGRRCIEGIAAGLQDTTVAVVGHGTLFSLVTAGLKEEPPTEARKASIGFAHAAIIESGSGLRLVRDFREYGMQIERDGRTRPNP